MNLFSTTFKENSGLEAYHSRRGDFPSFTIGLIIIESGTAVFKNCSIINNRGLDTSYDLWDFLSIRQEDNSSVICLRNSFVELDVSTVTNNSCTGNGGAIHALNVSLTIHQSTFMNNRAVNAEGGAISLEKDSTLITHNCQFIGNSATSGGAIMVTDHSSYSDQGSDFIENKAKEPGTFLTVTIDIAF